MEAGRAVFQQGYLLVMQNVVMGPPSSKLVLTWPGQTNTMFSLADRTHCTLTLAIQGMARTNTNLDSQRQTPVSFIDSVKPNVAVGNSLQII